MGAALGLPLEARTNAADTARLVDLVPRSVLFRSPTYSEMQISPDGKQLAYFHPLNGVLNIWVAPIDDLASAVAITRFDTRPPDSFQWSADGRFILIL
ncbi:TolB family protein, partial [Sphingopyxis sp.]|uniref:TolB family protein n=1 Tax=Sphingopyxis sp. TaxID=1908224 RepID=UPI0039C8DE69